MHMVFKELRRHDDPLSEDILEMYKQVKEGQREEAYQAIFDSQSQQLDDTRIEFDNHFLSEQSDDINDAN